MDCCNAGSATRKGTRGQLIESKSHVLLAACGPSEGAKEIGGRGNFTTGFLQLLRTIPPDNLRYSDVLLHMDIMAGYVYIALLLLSYLLTVPNCQNPQCEGVNQQRLLFNGKVLPPFSIGYTIGFQKHDKHSKPAELALEAASAEGITLGAQFAVYNDSSMTKFLANVTVESQSSLYSTMAYPPALHLDGTCIAVQTHAGVKAGLPLFIPRDDRFREIYLKALMLESSKPARYQPNNIVLVPEEASASSHLKASMKNESEVVFEMKDRRATHYGSTTQFMPVPTDDLYRVANVLSQIVHYYRELNRLNSDPDITGKIDLEFYKLDAVEHDVMTVFRPASQNFCHQGDIDFVVEEDAFHDFKLINRSHLDIYPYVFYFDNSTLAIGMPSGISLTGGKLKNACRFSLLGTYYYYWWRFKFKSQI